MNSVRKEIMMEARCREKKLKELYSVLRLRDTDRLWCRVVTIQKYLEKQVKEK